MAGGTSGDPDGLSWDFRILMAAVSLEEEPLAGAEWGIALNIAVILAGLFLIFAPTHRNPARSGRCWLYGKERERCSAAVWPGSAVSAFF